MVFAIVAHPVRRGFRRMRSESLCAALAARDPSQRRNAPPKRGITVVMGCVSRPLNLSSVKDADRQPLVTTGAGGGYLPIGYLPTGYLPTGAGAGGGGSLRGRSAAAAARRAPRADERNVKNLASVPINRGSGAAAVVADKAVIAQVRKRLMAACGAPAAGRGAASRSQGFRGSPSFFVWRPVCLLRIKHARL
jgi:hypothetical protein